MVDKIITLRRTKLRGRIGRLDPSDLVQLDRSVLLFLGLAG
jgi:mRNA interferase MazF